MGIYEQKWEVGKDQAKKGIDGQAGWKQKNVYQVSLCL